MKTTKMLDPIPPGEILMEEFMRPLGISINALARDLAVPPNRISGTSTARGRSRPIRPSGWASTSACLRSSGWTCSQITSCGWHARRPGLALRNWSSPGSLSGVFAADPGRCRHERWPCGGQSIIKSQRDGRLHSRNDRFLVPPLATILRQSQVPRSQFDSGPRHHLPFLLQPRQHAEPPRRGGLERCGVFVISPARGRVSLLASLPPRVDPAA